MQTQPRGLQTGVVIASAFLALGFLAGCVGGGGEPKSEGDQNKAPEARLTAGKTKAFTGETVTFDARDSSDADGNITSWRFDFGDQTTHEAFSEDQARVDHKYLQGGEFTVTVVVTDNGKDRAGSLADSEAVNIAIDERFVVVQQTAAAAPTNGTEGSKFNFPFKTWKGADKFEIDLEFTSTIPLGSSEMRIKVFDPENEVLDEETVTLSPGQTEEVNLAGVLDETGEHRLEVTAMSGGALYDGEIRVYYSEGY